MNVVDLPIKSLKPYKNNPRKNDKAVEYVANSIRQFGFKVPIVIDENYEIVCGHTRWKAAKTLGLETVPCVMADDLTPEQVQAYRLADNKTAEMADWDFDLLELEFNDIDPALFDMSDFGFFQDDEPGKKTPAEIVEDEAPEVDEVEPCCKRGQIWTLGCHRLMCGDSTNLSEVEKLLGGVEADMVFTDPPYGMGLNTDFSSMKNHLDFAKEKGFTGGKKYAIGAVDDFHPEMIETILGINAKEVFLWGADYYAELLPERNSGSWIVWDKRSNSNDDINQDYSSDKMYGSCFELCWSKKKHKRDIARVKWAGVFGTEKEPDHKRFHPTQKPVGLSAWFLNRYSEKNGIVLDLFGGSGSTMIACEQTGRQCRMMELDPHYCDVIIKRWENLTGQKAVLVEE